MDEDDYQREAWYTSLPGYPFIFYSENDRYPFAFREGQQGIEIITISRKLIHNTPRTFIGSFDEGDSRTTLYGTAKTATIKNLLPYTESAMQRTVDFVNYIEDNHFVQCNTKYWDKKIPKLFAASSSSSGESSTSNSSRETPKQKPKKDEKKVGTSITAASRTEERTQPSIGPDEHRRIMEKRAADHEKKREAYEREKQKPKKDEKKVGTSITAASRTEERTQPSIGPDEHRRIMEKKAADHEKKREAYEREKQKPKKDEKKVGTSITAASRTEERTQPSIGPDEHRRIMEKKAADHEKKREAYEREKQKPKKDEKKVGTSITAASRTEERTQPSIGPDEHRRIMEKKAADHEKKREAYEKEKQKRGDEEKKRENPIEEQFNADRRRHMADAREDAKKYLRDVSPGGVVLRKKKN